MQSALVDSLLLNASHSGAFRTKIPALIYGCAWKKEKTENLVYQALSSGLRGIDVALQWRHYREDLAGEGVRRAIGEGKVKREDLFIQTKFSPIDAHDPEDIPYDPHASITEQVKRSIATSLKNLSTTASYPSQPGSPTEDTTYLDSVVLHSPLRTLPQTLEAWTTLESFVPSGQIRNIGISNANLPVLKTLWDNVKIKPAVVQNRFYRDTDYDIPLRQFCREKGIVYQSFWTLSANPALLRHPSVVTLAGNADVSKEVGLYAMVLALEGTVVCNGTTTHMVEDVEGLAKVREWVEKEENDYQWKNLFKHFKDATGDNNPEAMPEESADPKIGGKSLPRHKYREM